MNLINKIKPRYLLSVLAIIVISLALFLFSLIKPSRELPPTITPTIPFITSVPTLPPGVAELRIVRTAPIQNAQAPYLPIQSIELTFTNPILPQQLRYTIIPHVETTVRQGSIPNALIIRPVLKWEDGETVVTILTTTTTSSGAKMVKPYIYIMRSSLPLEPHGGGNY